ncbi:MAG: FecR domain-containing protein [Polyangiaceae bacterium]|nr:FecR domain-containing protein [Polyangiaceae bacterium]
MSDKPKKAPIGRTVRRIVLAALALGVIASVIVFVATRKPPPVKAAPIQARLELAAGQVTVDLGQGPERAVSGAPLLEDAKVAADKGARALIRLPDGSRLFLRGESAIRLGESSVALESGEYFVDAPPTDRKPTVHTVGGVTVTAVESGLDVKRQGDGAVVYVARGMATVTAKGGRVEVQAGEQASAEGDAAPKSAPLAFWDDWTGGMADFASGAHIPGAGMGSIYGVDVGALAGSPARPLQIEKQAVRAVLREGLSETEVDQTFFNPGERDVEGWYWFTVPESASVTGFAVETDGVLVEGEFTERREAAAQYGAAKASGHSPAILEWVDSHTYRARIYPVKAGGSRRVVLRYIELRPAVDGKLSYVYPMGAGEPVRIGEFSLSVDLGDAGKKMKIATLADARVENAGKHVTMRRSGYTPRADFQLEATMDGERPPLTVSRFAAGGESADYVMARYTPDIDWNKAKQQRADVVVVVDTSAAGDESARQLKTATAEAILRALSDDDRFALVALDVRPTVLHPKDGLSPASDKEIAGALEALADHSTGGATDLAALFDVALGRLHGAEQPAVVYVGDGIATSGEMSGEQLVERLRRALGTSRARLFTVGVGTDANYSLLSELARAGGGQSLSVDQAEETTARALELAAAIKMPTITDLEIDLGAGLDEPFTSASGKVSRGSEVVVLARTHHDLPRSVKVRGRIGGEKFEREYETKRDPSVLAAFVPRLWASEYVRRLLGAAEGPEAERGRIVSLGIEYGLMTPYTSILALESEAAYSRMGIQRKRSPLRGVELGALGPTEEQRLSLRFAGVPAASLPIGCSKLEGLADEEPAPAGHKAQAQSVPASPAPEQGYAPAEDKELSAEVPAPEPAAFEEKPSDDIPPPPAKMAMRPAPLATGRGGAVPLRRKSGPVKLDGKDEQDERRANDGDLIPATGKVELSTCSDAAERPLAQRVVLWTRRLSTAQSPADLLSRYDAARKACELSDWRAERTFLDLMQRHVDSEGGATLVLSHFSARPEVKKHLAKLILRRAVDARLVAAVEKTLFGSAVDWNALDLELSELGSVQARIAKVREAIAKAPDDPNGGMRLVKLLVEAGDKDEAVALGRRLRDQGMLTPGIARQLGDVLARAGHAEEAVRTYSEIVEFDPESTASRRLLGDIYLGHEWYEPAYRQYKTITEIDADDALGWLRLAAAAAGTGRVDEALRLERRVASAQGTPGPSDPRRWARLWSAARLARLIANPPKSAPGPSAMKRELKELGLFSGPGHLVLLTWEELGEDLLVVSRVDDKDVGLGEATDAAKAGLSAVLLTQADAADASFAARLRSVPADHALALRRQDVIWDGKDFKVLVKAVELPARQTEIAL